MFPIRGRSVVDVVQIPNLPSVIALTGAEQLEAVQSGVSVKITTAQISALGMGSVSGGAANQIVYQTGSNATGFIPAPTVPATILEWDGAAFSWVSGTPTTSITIGAVAIVGGTPNGLLYNAAGFVGNLATVANGVLVTSAGSVPSISSTLPSAVQGNITSLGTIASGTWNGGVIAGTYGGTGVDNSTRTITLGGNVAFSGAFGFTATLTGATNVTFPTSGTLSTSTGTVTSVSVTSANGVSGVVSTATTTPAITLTLGAITPTTVNGNTISTGTGVLTLGAGKTLTASNTLTLTATDGSTLAIGTGGTLASAAYVATGTSGVTVPLLNGANAWSGAQTFQTGTTTFGVQQTTRGALVLSNTAVGSFAATLQSSNSATVATSLTLPPDAGSNGQVLSTNGSGVLSWASVTTGTVTSMSVVTANGVSGSVATATTTPAVTLTLGAITPSSVNGNTITTGTGTLTLGAGKTFTASNTLTLTATDGSTLAIGTGGTLASAAYVATGTSGATIPLLNGANTWASAQIFNGGVQASGSNINGADGFRIRFNSRSGLSSAVDGNLQLGNNADTDFGRLQFGGATSSFPAIKRSSTSLLARLADDSGYILFQAQLQTAAAAVTGLTPGVLSATTNATIVIYDSSGQAYRVPCII